MNPNPPNQPYQPTQPPRPVMPPQSAPWIPPTPAQPRPPQKPNPIAAFWSRAWNSSPWAKVGLIIGSVILSCTVLSMCCGVGTAFVAALQPVSTAQPSWQYNAPNTAPHATPKATQPTATPKAPTATATPAKPATPTPTLSPAQQLAQSQADLQRIVKGNTNAKVETVALYSDGSAEVNINIGEQWDAGTAQTISKVDTFQLMRAIYSQWHSRPAKFVTVWLYVHGPTTDKYGNTNPDDLYASVSLTPQTAAKFQWDNLTSDTAWQAYDIALWAPVIQNG